MSPECSMSTRSTKGCEKTGKQGNNINHTISHFSMYSMYTNMPAGRITLGIYKVYYKRQTKTLKNSMWFKISCIGQ